MGRTFKRKSEAAKHYRWWQSSSWWDSKCSCEPWRNLSEARFFLFDRGILCHFSEHWRSSRLHCIGKSLSKACQKLVKSVPSKSHSVKRTTRSSLSGEESIWPLVSVTLTLMVVHQPWRRNELLSFGGDPLNYKKKHYKWVVSNGDRKAFKTFWKSVHVGLKVITWIVLAMPKRECGCTFWT